jgi:16S rRNA G966 N2-methylase RsmD
MIAYRKIKPIEHPVPAARQNARRHYGVHPYFTRRPFNVVREYIRHYSRDGDTILDPFGGSGVTAIEAYLENRIAIHNDINPLANFIACGIAKLAHGKLSDYRDALARVEAACADDLIRLERASEKEVKALLNRLKLPRNMPLPANSDVMFLFDLFEPKQLAALGIIRGQIDQITDKHARDAMLLAFSATVTKLNRTFLSANGRLASRGGSSIFSIYRYKVAKEPVALSFWPTFRERALNVLQAKSEIDQVIEHKRQTVGWRGEFHSHNRDILDLPDLLGGQVDYIFTDPPYGGHIAYLDLSTMWNAWLGTMPTKKAARSEIIVGGDEKHDEEVYIDRLGRSIRACVELLKKDRWLSVVFQHWNVSYFQCILMAAAESGADLRAAVSQVGDPIWSMHKKKGSASVLAGELILTFFKTEEPVRYQLGHKFDLESEIHELLADKNGPLYGESLFNKIVLRAWHSGALDSLDVSKDEFSMMLGRFGWQYDSNNHFWLRSGIPNRLI